MSGAGGGKMSAGYEKWFKGWSMRQRREEVEERCWERDREMLGT